MTNRLIVTLAIALIWCMVVQAESGPNVPCSPCGSEARFDAPRSGLWFNPERPGHGLTVEMQNGLLLGALYAYDSDGGAQWYTFNGPLLPIEGAQKFTFALTAELERFEGGTCVGCAYTAPIVVRDAGSITIEFTQRNHGAYSIEGGERELIIPVYVGVDAPLDFPGVVEYPFPVLSGDWVFAVDNPSIEGPWGGGAILLGIGNKRLVNDELFRTFKLAYSINQYTGTGDILGLGDITCLSDLDQAGGLLPPTCALSLSQNYPGVGSRNITFQLPYGDIGDNRLEALDPETGIRVRAYRVAYD